jgi:hypothetical protein
VKVCSATRTGLTGSRALLLTVDSNIGDFRQSVEKMKGTTGSAEPGRRMEPFTDFGHGVHDPHLNWNDLKWLKGIAGDIPIYLKGVSSLEVSTSRQKGALTVLRTCTLRLIMESKVASCQTTGEDSSIGESHCLSGSAGSLVLTRPFDIALEQASTACAAYTNRTQNSRRSWKSTSTGVREEAATCSWQWLWEPKELALADLSSTHKLHMVKRALYVL